MKRWPIIRHIRALWLASQAFAWAAKWGRLGIGTGMPNEHDLAYLRAVWRGEL